MSSSIILDANFNKFSQRIILTNACNKEKNNEHAGNIIIAIISYKKNSSYQKYNIKNH
jgi:hypothetical protein